MPFRLGTPELIILLVMVMLLFGVGRISKVAAEFGTAIRELRRGFSDEDKADEERTVQKS